MIALASQGHLNFTITPIIVEKLINDDLTINAVSEFNEAALRVEV